jgi:hypothetical protein
MEDQEAKPIIEALLFVSPEPVSVERLQEVLEGMDRERIQSLLEIIANGYEQNGHGLSRPGIYTKQEVPDPASEIRTALQRLGAIIAGNPDHAGRDRGDRGVGPAIKTLRSDVSPTPETRRRPAAFAGRRRISEYFGLRDLSASEWVQGSGTG